MFAILRTQEGEFDVKAAATALAKTLNSPKAETPSSLARSPGILVEGIEQEQAERCLRSLKRVGIEAISIPQGRVVEVPTEMTVKSCSLKSDAFHYCYQKDTLSVLWSKISWIDTVSVQERQRVSRSINEDPYVTFSEGGEGEGGGERMLRSRPMVEKRKHQLDVYVHETQTLIRLDLDGLKYHLTGLNVHPTNAQNRLALSIALASRAK